MVGFHVDVVHVRRARADVFGRDVASAERLDVPSVRPEERFTLAGAVVAENDRLAAAEIEPRHGGLVGHPPCEPEHVVERLRIRRIAPETGTPERGAQERVVDRDDPPIARGRLVKEADLLVRVLGEGTEKPVRRLRPGLSDWRGGRER
jgi:hypothetical protein